MPHTAPQTVCCCRPRIFNLGYNPPSSTSVDTVWLRLGCSATRHRRAVPNVILSFFLSFLLFLHLTLNVESATSGTSGCLVAGGMLRRSTTARPPVPFERLRATVLEGRGNCVTTRTRYRQYPLPSPARRSPCSTRTSHSCMSINQLIAP